jgi:hypothetical protein
VALLEKRESETVPKMQGSTHGMKWLKGVSYNSDRRNEKKIDGRRMFSPVGVVWQCTEEVQRT